MSQNPQTEARVQLLRGDYIDTLAEQLLKIRHQAPNIEKAGLRFPVNQKIQVGFLAVIATRRRTKYAHVPCTCLGGKRKNFVAFDFEQL